MSTQTGFREVYRNANAYEQLLLPHFFDGRTDEEVVADILANQFGSGYHGSLRIAEFGCGTGRITRHLEPYTREVLLERLHDAEARGQGSLTCTRLPGVAVASDRPAAVKWFTGVHLKGLGQLVGDPAVLGQVNDFVDLHTAASGQVLIPAGVHVIDYRATTGRDHHLPTGESR
jgi:hypothetical protein